VTRAEISSLAVHDQVRRHACMGLVTDVTANTVRIVWDGQGRVPTSYSKASASLQDVVLVCKAPETTIDGVVRRGYYTRP